MISCFLKAKLDTKEPSKVFMSSHNMYYRMMGNTGIQVSVLSYGFWATYGVKDRLQDNQGVEMAKECMKIARDAGVNCFDHAEAFMVILTVKLREFLVLHYPNFKQEDPELWRRSELVITTKKFSGEGMEQMSLWAFTKTHHGGFR